MDTTEERRHWLLYHQWLPRIALPQTTQKSPRHICLLLWFIVAMVFLACVLLNAQQDEKQPGYYIPNARHISSNISQQQCVHTHTHTHYVLYYNLPLTAQGRQLTETAQLLQIIHLKVYFLAHPCHLHKINDKLRPYFQPNNTSTKVAKRFRILTNKVTAGYWINQRTATILKMKPNCKTAGGRV